MSYTKPIASLVGTIVGAGIFGVPFVMARAGFLSGTILFAALVLLMVFLHLMYADVVSRTKGRHRLMGYTHIYFGRKLKNLISVSVVVSLMGALVVYILMANDFLQILFGKAETLPFEGIFWGILFWIILSAAIVRGLKAVSKIEVFMLVFLVAVLAVIVLFGAGHVSAGNLSSFSFGNMLIPYGVIIFSLAGFQAIPEMWDMSKKKGKLFKNSIIIGTLLAAAFTYVFALVVVGISGSATTNEAIAGLTPVLGSAIVYLGAIFGILALSTSYLILGSNLRESFLFDWNIPTSLSNLIIVGLPIGLILIGVQDFILVLGLVGAIFGAVNGSMTALLFIKSKKQGTQKPAFNLNIPKVVVYLTIVALILGGIYETIKIIAR